MTTSNTESVAFSGVSTVMVAVEGVAFSAEGYPNRTSASRWTMGCGRPIDSVPCEGYEFTGGESPCGIGGGDALSPDAQAKNRLCAQGVPLVLTDEGEILRYLGGTDAARRRRSILSALRRAPAALAAFAAAIRGDAAPLEALAWGPQDVPAVESYRAERYEGPRGRVFVTRRDHDINSPSHRTTLWVDRLRLVDVDYGDDILLEPSPIQRRIGERRENRRIAAEYAAEKERLIALFSEGHDLADECSQAPTRLRIQDGQEGGVVYDSHMVDEDGRICAPVISARGLCAALERRGLIDGEWHFQSIPWSVFRPGQRPEKTDMGDRW